MKSLCINPYCPSCPLATLLLISRQIIGGTPCNCRSSCCWWAEHLAVGTPRSGSSSGSSWWAEHLAIAIKIPRYCDWKTSRSQSKYLVIAIKTPCNRSSLRSEQLVGRTPHNHDRNTSLLRSKYLTIAIGKPRSRN